ncbi:MAG: hypothetical protein RBS19_06300 [Bacteroidales bacterium]|nr:hypothetical protein [Bacteroidales bacterium]MDY0216547.1 hypothetical protein [Bacteroidales bacterium]
MNAKEVHLDLMGNVYLISGNSLTKNPVCVDDFIQFQFPFNGHNVTIDASNSFKILLFFSNSRKIIYLNNYLSSVKELTFPDVLRSEEIPLVCNSYNNGIWLYNLSQNSLARYSADFNKQHEVFLNTIIEDASLIPTQVFEVDNQVFLGVPNYGVLIFDKFGSFIKRIPIIYPKLFRYYAGKFYFINQNSLFGYDPLKFEEQLLLTSAEEIISFDIAKDYIAIIDEKQELTVYEIR